ncbi:MAG TPA: cyclic pyranopterin monophosphate synthase MoaC [Polyangiaceae bacterium]|nr:cyclic pyranopterin monophosphate synthase MoaC [Polyangiaceae bacterium]
MASPGVYVFEAIDEALPYMPLAVRRVLDVLGRKLSLEGWLSLPIDDRWALVRAGAGEGVDPGADAVLQRAVPAPSRIDATPDPDPTAPPRPLVAALGPSRPLDESRWRSLSALGRYGLAKCAARPEKLARAYDEIAGGGPLTHLTAAGDAHMVDVGQKPESARRAVASARVRTTRSAVEAIARGAAAKGDVTAAARIAGILAVKRTSELVPLCHPVRTTRAAVDFELRPEAGELRVRATVEAVDRTGCEMEAMVAASVASLTVYDMIKSVDRWATIDAVCLESKSGGKSGDLRRPPERGGS